MVHSRFLVGLASIAAAVTSGGQVLAQAAAANALPGYVCMEQTAGNDSNPTLADFPPVYQSSRPDAVKSGVAAGMILASNPPKVENGRRQILRTDGSIAWIDSRFLKPWTGRTPTESCTPTLLSNGRRGYVIR